LRIAICKLIDPIFPFHHHPPRVDISNDFTCKKLEIGKNEDGSPTLQGYLWNCDKVDAKRWFMDRDKECDVRHRNFILGSVSESSFASSFFRWNRVFSATTRRRIGEIACRTIALLAEYVGMMVIVISKNGVRLTSLSQAV